MPHKRKNLNIEGPNLWYLIGLIASDGCLSPDGRHIDITSNDYEFLAELKIATGLNNKIGVKQKAYHIQFANRNFYDFLVSIGLTQRKSLTIGALKIPKRFFVDFLRGLIDGDGSIRSWKHPTNLGEQWSLRIYSGSNKFLKWLDEKIKKYLMVRGQLYQYNIQGTQYVLKFGKMAAKVILEHCYYDNSFALKRKSQLAQQCIHSYSGWKRSQTVFRNINRRRGVGIADDTDLKSVAL